jgi:hypothetical protein
MRYSIPDDTSNAMGDDREQQDKPAVVMQQNHPNEKPNHAATTTIDEEMPDANEDFQGFI